MAVQTIYILGLEGELTVRYTDELLLNVTHGLTPIVKLSEDMRTKLAGLDVYDKIIFKIPSRSVFPYALLEHLVHLMNTETPCYVLYADDPIRYRIAPVSIFSYTIIAAYNRAALGLDDKLIGNFVKTNVKDFHVTDVHTVEIKPYTWYKDQNAPETKV